MMSRQLERVGGYGYSSKDCGSGFGLHATANFMRSIGGDIRFSSEGEGRGATVTLSFPQEVKRGDG